MHANSYYNLHVILAERNYIVSRNISAAMFARGIRDIAVCSDGDSLYQAVAAKPIDVLLCDAELPGMDFCKTIQNIRHNRIGHNPFVQVLGTTIVPTESRTRQAMDAGVDGLLGKPLSAKMVISHIDRLTRNRKPFVISDSYIGPSRRLTQRMNDSDCELAVPNTLRCKVFDAANSTSIQKLITLTQRRIDEMKGKSPRQVLTSLADRVVNHFSGENRNEDLDLVLTHLIEKSRKISDQYRCRGSQPIATITTAIEKLSKRIRDGGKTPKKNDVALLSALTKTVGVALSPGRESTKIVMDIARMVDQLSI